MFVLTYVSSVFDEKHTYISMWADLFMYSN